MYACVCVSVCVCVCVCLNCVCVCVFELGGSLVQDSSEFIWRMRVAASPFRSCVVIACFLWVEVL